MTDALLIVGVAAALGFVAVLLVEGAFRPGYKSTYHTGSALSLGRRGWVQVANFLQLGVGMFAFAAGIYQRLNNAVGAVLMGIFGLGAIVAGIFPMDPMRGYPPGTPSGTPAELTMRHQIHDAAGPVMFLAICGACLALARALHGPWQLYTVLTAVTGLALTISTAAAWHKDARYTGLVQRALILVYCGWIVLLGIRLLSNGDASSRRHATAVSRCSGERAASRFRFRQASVSLRVRRGGVERRGDGQLNQ